MEVTQELLHQLFEYKNGKLYWKEPHTFQVKKGEEVGWVDPQYGYKRCSLKGKFYQLHRLIFMYFNGYIPRIVDHIDNNKLNNSIENLREASISQNAMNSKIPVTNTSGIKGVVWHKKAKKWMVQVVLNKKSIYCGLYEDLELAELVAQEARLKYHGEYANHGNNNEDRS